VALALLVGLDYVWLQESSWPGFLKLAACRLTQIIPRETQDKKQEDH